MANSGDEARFWSDKLGDELRSLPRGTFGTFVRETGIQLRVPKIDLELQPKTDQELAGIRERMRVNFCARQPPARLEEPLEGRSAGPPYPSLSAGSNKHKGTK